MVRNPVVAGQFYSDSKGSLTREVEALIDRKARREDALGVVSPHAGYVYSGAVAGGVLSSIKPKEHYIIIGPNHTGIGRPFGISTDEAWKTPLGEVGLNKKLADAIKADSNHIEYDDLPHAYEHSIEVQLPFLQLLQSDFTFVPIVVSCATIDIYRRLGKSIAIAIKKLHLDKSVAIIASSDMTHYESHEAAKRKDSIAIDAMLELDEDRLIDSISKFDITMCGYAAAAIMLAASKELGASKAKLIKYQTSAEASGDYSSVVGYAGLIVY